MDPAEDIGCWVQAMGIAGRECLLRMHQSRTRPELESRCTEELMGQRHTPVVYLDLGMAAGHVGSRRSVADRTVHTAAEVVRNPAVVGSPVAVAEGNFGRSQEFRGHYRMALASRRSLVAVGIDRSYQTS
jgi:hypothetical protein